MPDATPWLRLPVPRPDARLRLLCFHSAGGGPSLFRTWSTALPADIEVLAVHLPGRETRLRERCLTDYRTTIRQLYAQIRPFLARPYALFGHSMGALLAYGVAQAAAEHGDPAPLRLLVSGCGGPGTPHRDGGRSRWSDDRLLAELRRMGGTPEEVLAVPGLLDMILPPLRADYSLVETFPEAAGQPLTCPVSVLGGESDDIVAEDLGRWSAVTEADTSLRLFPGGHFFLFGPSAEEVCASVTDDLAAVIRP